MLQLAPVFRNIIFLFMRWFAALIGLSRESAVTKLPRYEGIFIDLDTAGVLASSESKLAHFDAMASKCKLRTALKRQLLRIDAICSSSIDGRRVRYEDVATLEAAVMNSPFSDDDNTSLVRLAKKSGLADGLGDVVCYRYMKTVEWVSRNIGAGMHIDRNIFSAVRRLYNESEIGLLSDLEESGIDDFEPDAREGPAFGNEQYDELLREYVDLVNSNTLLVSVQAELSHAHLQLMKPYAGNLDAFERIFSYVVFYRRGLLTGSIAPLAVGPSLNVKQHTQSIASNMTSIAKGSFTPEIVKAVFQSTAFCTNTSTRVAQICMNVLDALWTNAQKKIDTVRSDSTVMDLAKLFLEWPYLTVAIAAEKLDRSFSATNNAMHALLKCGYIAESGRLSKHRLFCATELVEAFQDVANRVISGKPLNRDTILTEILEGTEVLEGELQDG